MALKLTFALVAIIHGEAFTMDSGLTLSDCVRAAMVTGYACELESN